MTGQFFDAFIDDFYSECDEHLATVRRVLLSLQGAAGVPPDPRALQQLARTLHTLKGLSGMVGLSAAEEVAHAMEDCVRAVDSQASMPPQILEALFSGEEHLEAAVAARRAGDAIPSPGPYVDRVTDVLARSLRNEIETGVTPRSSPTQLAALPRPRGAVVRFEFVPSSALASRGIGVEFIRKRLGAVGEITATVPRVVPGGVSFEFVVSVHDISVPPPGEWHEDGLVWDDWPDADADAPLAVVVHSARPAPATPLPTTSNVVRVDLGKLDELMRLVGELVVTRARLGDALKRVTGLASNDHDDLHAANETIDRQLRMMREGVMRIRLVPVGEVFERMRFAMRDIARETGKGIAIEFAGQDTQIDKLVVDRLLEPLLHLVRNSASHGIESREQRLLHGKPVDGTIMLRARAAGDRILLDVEDDGAGIDVDRVGQRARQMGLISTNEELAPDALLDVICAPGFSTREATDMTSGRGVGMSVVRSTIRALGGELFVESSLGRGTRFLIELPLTLMITDALILEVGNQTMAIPQVALREIVPLDPAAVTRFENNEVLSYRGRVVPLVNLAKTFNLAPNASATRHVLIVGSETHLAGLIADRVIGLREIVVHPTADPLVDVDGVAGATELADGRVSLVLDAAALVRKSREHHSRIRTRALHASPPATTSAVRIQEHTWS